MTNTRQHERHMEEVSRSKHVTRHKTKSGMIEHDEFVSDFEDSLADDVHEGIFDGIDKHDEQEMLQDFGGGISVGAPKGGWPMFDSAGQRISTSNSQLSHA